MSRAKIVFCRKGANVQMIVHGSVRPASGRVCVHQARALGCGVRRRQVISQQAQTQTSMRNYAVGTVTYAKVWTPRDPH